MSRHLDKIFVRSFRMSVPKFGIYVPNFRITLEVRCGGAQWVN